MSTMSTFSSDKTVIKTLARQIERLDEQIEALQKQNDALQKQNEALKAENEALQASGAKTGVSTIDIASQTEEPSEVPAPAPTEPPTPDHTETPTETPTPDHTETPPPTTVEEAGPSRWGDTVEDVNSDIPQPEKTSWANVAKQGPQNPPVTNTNKKQKSPVNENPSITLPQNVWEKVDKLTVKDWEQFEEISESKFKTRIANGGLRAGVFLAMQAIAMSKAIPFHYWYVDSGFLFKNTQAKVDNKVFEIMGHIVEFYEEPEN